MPSSSSSSRRRRSSSSSSRTQAHPLAPGSFVGFESPQQPTQRQQIALAGAGQGERGSNNVPATTNTALAEPAATALILTFLSGGDAGQSKFLFVVLGTLGELLAITKPNDGLASQASADCLSRSPIMMASHMRAAGRGTSTSIQERTHTKTSMPKSQFCSCSKSIC